MTMEIVRVLDVFLQHSFIGIVELQLGEEGFAIRGEILVIAANYLGHSLKSFIHAGHYVGEEIRLLGGVQEEVKAFTEGLSHSFVLRCIHETQSVIDGLLIE
ncbi:MAG: hypothetical protein RL042_1974 [Nitrospirota bacterium]